MQIPNNQFNEFNGLWMLAWKITGIGFDEFGSRGNRIMFRIERNLDFTRNAGICIP